mmetsp:Transcript_185/g.406  ORF Transcript_185/g.406 Transcript_185/m.406 type:complete len:128 (+) Transcript_185:464-847(+)
MHFQAHCPLRARRWMTRKIYASVGGNILGIAVTGKRTSTSKVLKKAEMWLLLLAPKTRQKTHVPQQSAARIGEESATGHLVLRFNNWIYTNSSEWIIVRKCRSKWSAFDAHATKEAPRGWRKQVRAL